MHWTILYVLCRINKICSTVNNLLSFKILIFHNRSTTSHWMGRWWLIFPLPGHLFLKIINNFTDQFNHFCEERLNKILFNQRPYIEVYISSHSDRVIIRHKVPKSAKALQYLQACSFDAVAVNQHKPWLAMATRQIKRFMVVDSWIPQRISKVWQKLAYT